MSKIDKLIQEFCPKGVERLEISKICKTISTGKQRNRDTLSKVRTPEMQYPVINGGISPSGYTDEFNTKEDTITISQGGASAGFVSFIQEPFWSGAHCYTVEPDDTEIILNRFLYFFLKDSEKILMDRAMGAGIPGLNRKALNSLKIPIPPLEVQKEIVNILDKFTQLEAELELEREARSEQYKYYLEKIINNHDWPEMTVLEMLSRPITDGPHETPKFVEQGVPFISAEAIQNGRIDFGKKRGFITKEYDDICARKYKPQKGDVYLVKSGSTTGKVAMVVSDEDFNIWSPIAAMRVNEANNPRFLYHLLRSKSIQTQVQQKASHGSQPNLSMRSLEKFAVRVPKIEEQDKIVEFLDKLDTLVNDTHSGIPSELKHRREQYEYYRTKLLTFQELPA